MESLVLPPFGLYVELYSHLRTAGKLKYLAVTKLGVGAFAADILPADTVRKLREMGG